MEELDVGVLPVCEGGRVIGMVTDRDIVIRAVASGREPTRTKVCEILSTGVVVAHEDQDVEEAARLMQRHQIRRVPVVRDGRKLVGIVSLGDLAVKTDDRKQVRQALEDISQPSMEARERHQGMPFGAAQERPTSHGRGPKGYKRADERIREDVCDRLTEHGDIDASDIEVKVQNGEVTLTGTVQEKRFKHMAERIVESLSGVQEVHNQLRIKREDASSSVASKQQAPGNGVTPEMQKATQEGRRST
jgi:osmotically-inducible protein OsmY